MSTNPYVPTGPPAYPYPYPYPYAPPLRPPYDGRSVTALLLLGTVVAAPASVVLGVLGVRATSGGRRRGRWCAVLAIVGGVLVLALLAGGLVLRGTLLQLGDPLGGVATGDCADVRLLDEEDYASRVDRRSCTGPHDAEVVFRGRLDGVQASLFFTDSAAELCHQVMSEGYRDEMATGRYSMSVLLVGEPWEAEDGDEFVCLAGDAGGDPLHARIGVSA